MSLYCQTNRIPSSGGRRGPKFVIITANFSSWTQLNLNAKTEILKKNKRVIATNVLCHQIQNINRFIQHQIMSVELKTQFCTETFQAAHLAAWVSTCAAKRTGWSYLYSCCGLLITQPDLWQRQEPNSTTVEWRATLGTLFLRQIGTWPQIPKFVWGKNLLHFESYCCHSTAFCHLYHLFPDMPWLLAWPYTMCLVCEQVITG